MATYKTRTTLPNYDFNCKKHGPWTDIYPMASVPDSAPCPKCNKKSKRTLFYKFSIYGADKFHDKVLADASEASGGKITSTKQVDALEKAGKMYAITNPSRHRHFKDKK